MCSEPEHLPQGAMRQCDDSVVWRIWAPLADNVQLVLFPDGNRKQVLMTPAGYGYFVHHQRQAHEGLRYAYKPANVEREYPDPASRWQPDGVHRPSAVFFPESYTWSDNDWHGLPLEQLVIYELHVGAFTPQGTFEAIIARLDQLASLGVTAVELMPVAQFPGDRNWGYDGVHPNAVQNSYGGPRALQQLVDAAHERGMAIFLDVVYNHIGPEGNYFSMFGHYFTDRYHTPWGRAINFDGPDCDAVRQFVIDNACMWVRDFHIDGLRLDAVQTIYDFMPQHILADIKAGVERVARSQSRIVHVIAETNQNNVRLINPPECGGYGLDGVWNDDFHHSIHALLTGEQDGYYQDFGRPEQIVKAYNKVFVNNGCYSRFYRRRHGAPAGDQSRTKFVVCVQDHDQVGNRALGERFSTLLPAAAQRLTCSLLMLSPYVPLIFMGEEYSELHGFPFFCSFGDPDLIEAVRRGRREEFTVLRFRWGADIPDPQSPETFQSAKLTWSWPEGSFHAQIRQLYKDLLTARHEWQALVDRVHTSACLATVSDGSSSYDVQTSVLLIERGGKNGVLAVANLSAKSTAFPQIGITNKHIMLSTEDVRYGGDRTECESVDMLLPYELLVFGGR